MEYHVQRFFDKLRPAFGLLRRGNEGTLLANTSTDVENGLPNLTQNPSQDVATNAAEDAPQSHGIGNIGTDREDPVDRSAINDDPHEYYIVQDDLPQPQFTEGPSRFVLAKDGSRDCVALLVSEAFLARLRDLFEETRDLSALDEPLSKTKTKLRNIERSVEQGQTTLETADSEEQADNHHKVLEQQTSELHRLRRFKDGLEKERGIVKENLELSRNHTQWVLETAMREADLLGPEKPLPAILLREEEVEDTESVEERIRSTEDSMPAHQSPAASTTSTASKYSEREIDQEEIQRHEAYEDFVERSQYLDKVQEKFDGQGDLYHENLAEYQDMAAAGTTNMSRSDFDRRKVRYGQQLTRALIDAEEEFEEARERAQALGAIGSDYGHEFYYGAEYAESWPENQIAEYNAAQDWSFVEDWMDDIPDSTSQADFDSVEIDEWDVEEVEVNDSISMMDCEDYRQDIDRYQRMCARLEDPCPEVRWLGQPDGRLVERRSSCWM